MNEATLRREIYSALRRAGYWPTRGRDASACPKCGTLIVPPIGRPDLLVLHPTKTAFVIEVKAVNIERIKSFPLAELTDEQRRWMTAWADEGGMAYVAIGSLNVRPRRLFLVPWTSWTSMESKLDGKSIPFDLSLLKRRIGVIDLCTEFAEHEVRYERGWQIAGGIDGHTT